MADAAVIVVFRVWSDNSVLALFPELDEGRGMCRSYEHLGQHGAAHYAGCIRRTRPALEAEYAHLKRELEQVGYNLCVRKRRVR